MVPFTKNSKIKYSMYGTYNIYMEVCHLQNKQLYSIKVQFVKTNTIKTRCHIPKDIDSYFYSINLTIKTIREIVNK